MKEGWLAARGIEDEWPVYGIPERLHLDNAKELQVRGIEARLSRNTASISTIGPSERRITAGISSG